MQDDEDDDEENEIEFEMELTEEEEEELTLDAIYESIEENRMLMEQLHVLYQLTHLEVKNLKELIKEKKFFHLWN